jgi:outer membrane biogenesis lipoprotein LolB
MKKFLFAASAALLLASCSMSSNVQATYQVKHGKVTKLSKGQTPDCIRNW